MRIAVTAKEPSAESPMDPRFGRAAWFMVFDTEKNQWEQHENSQNLHAAQGAGIQAGQTIISLDVNVLISGNVGPKAFAILEAGDIAIYMSKANSVKEAVDAYQDRSLEKQSNPNVEGHWV